VGEFANGLVPGQIKTLVDPLPYVSAVANTTTSNSGAETESDESYRERIRIAPESLSVAGSEGAYRSRVLNAHQNIVDVAIINPSPGIVRIYPLMEGAELPSEEVKNTIMEACSDKTVRPLTDLVEVVDPEIVNYSISFTYYISETSESLQTVIASQIEDAVDEFITWQKSRLGYGINTSKLICMVVTAGASRVDLTASSYPSIGESQVAVATAQSIIYGGVEND
jgi:phage-related baseplate assembly protein